MLGPMKNAHLRKPWLAAFRRVGGCLMFPIAAMPLGSVARAALGNAAAKRVPVLLREGDKGVVADNADTHIYSFDGTAYRKNKP